MTDTVKLIEPTMAYAEQIRSYRKEFLDHGGSMDGTSSLEKFEDPQAWIESVNDSKNPLTVPKDRVPATQYILVREEDQKIVGMIQIRHFCNDYLEQYGGHIGYSVAPTERRKGYATQMLDMTLIECQKLGLDKVLITCLTSNEGSRKTILKNGGVYESTVHEPNKNVDLERYWIDVSCRKMDAQRVISPNTPVRE